MRGGVDLARLRVRPRAADWRTQERDFAKPHVDRKTPFTYIKIH